MQIELTPAQNSFIDLGIQEGRFQNRDEAVRQALAEWEDRQRSRAELLVSLELADQSLDDHAGEEYTLDSLPQLAHSIAERGRKKLACQ